jgi:alanyl-tRNA synthetase
MDFNLPEVPPGFKQTIEDLVNAEVEHDRRIDARILPREDAFAIPDIIQNLIPDDVEDIRIVDINGLDVQADGSTHVASTKQIGRMTVVKVETKAARTTASASASPTYLSSDAGSESQRGERSACSPLTQTAHRNDDACETTVRHDSVGTDHPVGWQPA